MMEFIFSIMTFFVWHPVRVFIVAAILSIPCFLSSSAKISKWVCGAAAGLWTVYGIWETYMTAWRSETGDMAIRIDMIVIGPLVLAAALVGVLLIFKKSRGAA